MTANPAHDDGGRLKAAEISTARLLLTPLAAMTPVPGPLLGKPSLRSLSVISCPAAGASSHG